MPEEVIKTFDFDRLYEADENFLETNDYKPLALKSHTITHDKDGFVRRKLMGATETYKQGLQMDEIKRKVADEIQAVAKSHRQKMNTKKSSKRNGGPMSSSRSIIPFGK